MNVKYLKAILVLLLAAGAAFFWWRRSTPIPIYVSNHFDSSERRPRDLLPAENNTIDGMRLFAHTLGARSVSLHISNSRGNPELSSEQVMDFLRRPDPKLVFGPVRTDSLKVFLPKLKASPPPSPDAFLLSQITVDPALHAAIPTLSSYYSASDYFSGIVPIILSRELKPGRAHILRLAGREHYRLLSEAARKELAKAGISAGPDLIFDPWPRRDLEAAWRKLDVKPGDWVIIIDQAGSGRRLERIWQEPSFKWATIILAEGSHESRDRLLGEENIRSWELLRWHPWFHYKNEGELTNCAFVKKFWERFGYMPDFRSAYMFALLEKMARLDFKNPFLSGGPDRSADVPTILGRWKWAKDGQLEGRMPLLLRHTEGRTELFLRPEIGEPCESARGQLRRTVLIRP
jgi:hypothetical protein